MLSTFILNQFLGEQGSRCAPEGICAEGMTVDMFINPAEDTTDGHQEKLFWQQLGARVLRARKRRNLDQLALARLTGYKDASAITQIEKGKMKPSVPKLLALAKALGMGIQDFVEDEISVEGISEERRQQVVPLCEAAAVLPPHVVELLTALARELRSQHAES